MRFASFIHDGAARVGVVADATVAVLPDTYGDDLLRIIAGGPAARVEIEQLVASGRLLRIPVDSLRLLAPLRHLRRDVLCTGWNYWDHFDESKGKREGQDVDKPKAPAFFTKGPDVVIGPNDDIGWDRRVSAQWDYEGEIALVIGKDGRSIAQSDALNHVWGYCLANDVSQRDLQRRHGGQWLKGKSIDGTMPLGPWLVTADEVDLDQVRLQCLLNGKVMQDASTRQMAFPVAELIAELSFGMTLRAGDLLLTGTPPGIGHARTPPVYLQEGDEVVVRATGLGELRNRLVAVDLCGSSNVARME